MVIFWIYTTHWVNCILQVCRLIILGNFPTMSLITSGSSNRHLRVQCEGMFFYHGWGRSLDIVINYESSKSSYVSIISITHTDYGRCVQTTNTYQKTSIPNPQQSTAANSSQTYIGHFLCCCIEAKKLQKSRVTKKR